MTGYVLSAADITASVAINAILASRGKHINNITLTDGRVIMPADLMSDGYWSSAAPIAGAKQPVGIDPILIIQNKLQWLLNHYGLRITPDQQQYYIDQFTLSGSMAADTGSIP